MATSLLDWIMQLLKDSEAREAFQADPKAAMSAAGMTSICGSDVRDARPYLLDNPNVHQVRQFESAQARTPHEQVRDIVDSYRVEPQQNYLSDKGKPDHDGPGKFAKQEHSDRYYDGAQGGHGGHYGGGYGGGPSYGGGYGGGPSYDYGPGFGFGYGPHKETEDSFNKVVEDNDNVKETGPASGKASAAANQGGSTVGNDQLSIGGNQPTVGDNNDSSKSFTDNSTLNEDDNSRTGNDVTGDGSAGRDINTETGGAVFGQGIAGGDMDHVGGLVGLKDIIGVGNVNVLSGIANLNDVLNGSAFLNNPLANPLQEGIHDIDLGSILQDGILNSP